MEGLPAQGLGGQRVRVVGPGVRPWGLGGIAPGVWPGADGLGLLQEDAPEVGDVAAIAGWGDYGGKYVEFVE